MSANPPLGPVERHHIAVKKYKAKMIAKGYCAHCCGTRSLETLRLCAKCAEKHRERARVLWSMTPPKHWDGRTRRRRNRR